MFYDRTTTTSSWEHPKDGSGVTLQWEHDFGDTIDTPITPTITATEAQSWDTLILSSSTQPAVILDNLNHISWHSTATLLNTIGASLAEHPSSGWTANTSSLLDILEGRLGGARLGEKEYLDMVDSLENFAKGTGVCTLRAEGLACEGYLRERNGGVRSASSGRCAVKCAVHCFAHYRRTGQGVPVGAESYEMHLHITATELAAMLPPRSLQQLLQGPPQRIVRGVALTVERLLEVLSLNLLSKLLPWVPKGGFTRPERVAHHINELIWSDQGRFKKRTVGYTMGRRYVVVVTACALVGVKLDAGRFWFLKQYANLLAGTWVPLVACFSADFYGMKGDAPIFASGVEKMPLLELIWLAKLSTVNSQEHPILKEITSRVESATDELLLSGGNLLYNPLFNEQSPRKQYEMSTRLASSIAYVMLVQLLKRHPTWSCTKHASKKEFLKLVHLLDQRHVPPRLITVMGEWLLDSVLMIPSENYAFLFATLAKVGCSLAPFERKIVDDRFAGMLAAPGGDVHAMQLSVLLRSDAYLLERLEAEAAEGLQCHWHDLTSLLYLLNRLHDTGREFRTLLSSLEPLLIPLFKDPRPHALRDQFIKFLLDIEPGKDLMEAAINWMVSDHNAASIDVDEVPFALQLFARYEQNHGTSNERFAATKDAVFAALCGSILDKNTEYPLHGNTIIVSALCLIGSPYGETGREVIAKAVRCSETQLRFGTASEVMNIVQAFCAVDGLTAGLLEACADEVLWRILPDMRSDEIALCAEVFSRPMAGFSPPQTLFWCLAEETLHRFDAFSTMSLLRTFVSIVKADPPHAACLDKFYETTIQKILISDIPLTLMYDFCIAVACTKVNLADSGTFPHTLRDIRQKVIDLASDPRCPPETLCAFTDLGVVVKDVEKK